MLIILLGLFAVVEAYKVLNKVAIETSFPCIPKP